MTIVEQMDVLYRMLAEAARGGVPAPTNEAIARSFGWRSEGKASELLGRLEATGRVRVDRGHMFRVVHLPSLGLSTALPHLIASRAPMPKPRQNRGPLPPQPVVVVDGHGRVRPVPSMPACAPDRPRERISRFSACQWIEGESRENRAFCGAPVEPGKPYCACHARRAYCPPDTTHHDARAITHARASAIEAAA